jgi:hypothetical protein
MGKGIRSIEAVQGAGRLLPRAERTSRRELQASLALPKFESYAPIEKTAVCRLKTEARIEWFHGIGRLGTWVVNQRNRRGALSVERRRRLDAIKFVWALHSNTWETGSVALKEFKAREGHCLVPNEHKEGKFNLGRWVTRQRIKKDTLSVERRQRLKSLGFVWDPLELAWEKGFASLNLAGPNQAVTRTSSASHRTVQFVASQADRTSRTPAAEPAGPEGPGGPEGLGGPGSPFGPWGACPQEPKARATTHINAMSRILIMLPIPRWSGLVLEGWSFQLGGASAPTIPQPVHTMRGPNEGVVGPSIYAQYRAMMAQPTANRERADALCPHIDESSASVVRVGALPSMSFTTCPCSKIRSAGKG